MPIAKPLGMTNPVEVQSSSLARLSYDRQQATLQVEFRDGTQYQYSGVPFRTYQSLLQADSKGSYFNHYIRSRFPHTAIRGTASATFGLSPQLG